MNHDLLLLLLKDGKYEEAERLLDSWVKRLDWELANQIPASSEQAESRSG